MNEDDEIDPHLLDEYAPDAHADLLFGTVDEEDDDHDDASFCEVDDDTDDTKEEE